MFILAGWLWIPITHLLLRTCWHTESPPSIPAIC